MRSWKIALISLALTLSASAQEKGYNGYSLKDFKGFPEKWHFVTVRFRHDTREMRLTYANDIAAKALREGKTEYPDGAIFGKVGRLTEEDPLFPSSATPSAVKRFQFMVRDRLKFKSTDGWGYALFDDRGNNFPGEPKSAAQACAACHRIAESRGYVFSQFANFGLAVDSPQSPAKVGQFDFKSVKKSTLPSEVVRWIPAAETELMSIQGPLQKNVFTGTLDEIVPALAAQTIKTGQSSILISEDGLRYSVVLLDKLSTQCPAGKAMVSVRGSPDIPQKIVKKTFCHH